MDNEDVYVVQLEVLEGVLDGLDDLLPGQGLLLGPGEEYLTTSPPQHLSTSPPHHLTTSPPQHLSTSVPQHLSIFSLDMEKEPKNHFRAQILLVCANQEKLVNIE